MSNYDKRKQALIEMRNELLKDYQSLFMKAMEFGNSTQVLSMSGLTAEETSDFEKFFSEDADTMKVVSLVSALMYVEMPQNKEVVATLKRDININRNGRK